MVQNVILLSLSQYRIINEKTGEVETEGCTARYLLAEDLTHYEDNVRSVKGRVPAKATIPHDDFDKFQTVPGLYEVTLDYSIDSKGKASLAPKAFKFLSAISVNSGSGLGGFGKSAALGTKGIQ